ncbi:MAG: hypothetical protein WBO04_04750 [Steroidobacteraceae bacterium]
MSCALQLSDQVLANGRTPVNVVIEEAIVVEKAHADEWRDEPLADLVIPGMVVGGACRGGNGSGQRDGADQT